MTRRWRSSGAPARQALLPVRKGGRNKWPFTPSPVPRSRTSPGGDSGEPLCPFPDHQALPLHWGNAQAPCGGVLGWGGGLAASFLPSCQQCSLSTLPADLLQGLVLLHVCFRMTSLYLEISLIMARVPALSAPMGNGKETSICPKHGPALVGCQCADIPLAHPLSLFISSAPLSGFVSSYSK